MPLSIQIIEQKPGLHEVVLNGRLDTETAPQLERRFVEICAKKVSAVRLDMGLLSYISSMGIRVLFKTFKALRDKKAMFLMVNLQPQIKKVLEIAQAMPPETVFASIKEADEYYDAMQRKVLDQ
jgi:anti-sigma B factor antagonist